MSLEALTTEYSALKTKFETQIQDQMKVAFTEFFDANPEFVSVEWTQYTPYFNDGDPCEFRRGDFGYTARPEFYTDKEFAESLADGSYDIWDLDENAAFAVPSDYKRNSGYYKDEVAAFDALPDEEKARRIRLTAAWDKFSAALEAVDDDIFLAAFKDHVQVKVTRDGIEIEEYEHD